VQRKETFLIKINVGGLAAKEIVAKITEIAGDQAQARLTADIVGVREVSQGLADYYFGACATGGGGALSMAIAILGYDKCFTVCTAGKLPKEEEIKQAVMSGKKAFGFTCDHVDTAVPMLIKAILNKHNLVGPEKVC
jgi:hypothetical protein